MPRLLEAQCKLWPSAAYPKGFEHPIQSATPVLLLSGDLDPVTPPSWADLARKTLSNARHVVVPGRGHNVTQVGCMPKLMASFVDEPTKLEFDASCIEDTKPPSFFIDFAGP